MRLTKKQETCSIKYNRWSCSSGRREIKKRHSIPIIIFGGSTLPARAQMSMSSSKNWRTVTIIYKRNPRTVRLLAWLKSKKIIEFVDTWGAPSIFVGNLSSQVS